MERVVPWAALVQVVEPFAWKSTTVRPSFPIETMLWICYLQQWFELSDSAMEESLQHMPVYREFARLDGVTARLPYESTILRFRHLLERHDLIVDMLHVVDDILRAKSLLLRTGTAVDAMIISAPSSTKNIEGEREPEMNQTKKGYNCYFGLKAHIGVDVDSGLVDTVVGTAINVADISVARQLLHGQEEVAFGDDYSVMAEQVNIEALPQEHGEYRHEGG